MAENSIKGGLWRGVRADLGALTGFTVGGAVGALVLAQLRIGLPLRMYPWAVARASGISAYILLVALVALGMWNNHPWGRRWPILHPAIRLRSHVMLAALVVELSVIHIIAIIADPYARAGLAGALIPGAAAYRTFPVALGTFALYAATVTVISASMAGATFIGRWWQPLHRLAWAILILTWVHSVLAGTDTPPLRPLYAITGLGLLVLALARRWSFAAAAES